MLAIGILDDIGMLMTKRRRFLQFSVKCAKCRADRDCSVQRFVLFRGGHRHRRGYRVVFRTQTNWWFPVAGIQLIRRSAGKTMKLCMYLILRS